MELGNQEVKAIWFKQSIVSSPIEAPNSECVTSHLILHRGSG